MWGLSVETTPADDIAVIERTNRRATARYFA
jgi:hypothetical protein